MYYELYIDVFFAVNFMMDAILLMITRKILGCHAAYLRIYAGALTGAALTCLVIILPIPEPYVKLVLFHGPVSIAMIKTGLGIPWGRKLFQGWIILYISGFLTGGILQFFQQYVRTGSLFFLLAVAGYYTVSGIWEVILRLGQRTNSRCKVILYYEGKSCTVEALIDTGNSLTDPVTGNAVSILDKKTARRLLGNLLPDTLRYIPYHSIGKTQGVMPMVTLDKMTVICTGEKKEILGPMTAVCENGLTGEEFQMILNPDVLIGGVNYGNKGSSTTSI